MDARTLFAGVAAVVASALFVRHTKIQASIDRTLLRFGLSPAEIGALGVRIKEHSVAVYDEVASVPLAEARWENTLGRLLALEEEVDADASNVRCPQHVAVSKAVRDASADTSSMLKKLHVTLAMRRDVFLVVKAFADSEHAAALTDPEHKLFLKRTMRDYRRAGMVLADEVRDEVEKLRRDVKELETQFSQNLAEVNTTLLVTTEELGGMPAAFISSLDTADDGRKKLTLSYPHALPILRTCSVPETRKKMRVAFDCRAKDTNVAILEKIVLMRAKIASLLGYESHAHYELEVQMAKDPTVALPFLSKLSERLRPLAERDMAELKALKLDEEGNDNMNHWDVNYYMRKHVEQKHNINEQAIAEYFPLEVVQARMLGMYETLLGVKMQQVSNPHVWHKDVTMWSVRDKGTDRLMGYFYLDLYPRPGKYGHACCVPAQRGAGTNSDGSRARIAVASMLANFSPPSASRPSLLRHSEVVTFFHEFGHVMHHILSDTNNVAFASFDVETDFVEAPSQMLENWCWQEETLQQLSGHYKDHSKQLPVEFARALAASKDEHTALLTMRQLMFGIFDMKLHSGKDGEKRDTEAMLREMYPKFLLVDMPEGTNFAGSFGHLAGGYDSKYYSYMWSEVYSQDMFDSRFLKEGLLNPETGKSYRMSILAPGGTRDAIEGLREFLGREPDMEAFLRSKGLGQET